MKPRKERAVQFAPYAALRGFDGVIADRKRIREPRRELSEGEIARISDELSLLSLGDLIRVEYYEDGAYVTLVGILTEIDSLDGFLRVVKKRISFSDLYNVERMDTGK